MKIIQLFVNPHAVRANNFQQRFSVNVWACISNGNLGDIQLVDGRLNGVSKLSRARLQNRLHNILQQNQHHLLYASHYVVCTNKIVHHLIKPELFQIYSMQCFIIYGQEKRYQSSGLRDRLISFYQILLLGHRLMLTITREQLMNLIIDCKSHLSNVEMVMFMNQSDVDEPVFQVMEVTSNTCCDSFFSPDLFKEATSEETILNLSPYLYVLIIAT